MRGLIFGATLSAVLLSGCSSYYDGPPQQINHLSSVASLLPRINSDVDLATKIKSRGRYSTAIMLVDQREDRYATQVSFVVTSSSLAHKAYFPPLSYLPENNEHAFFLSEAVNDFVGIIRSNYPRARVDVSGVFRGMAERSEKGSGKVIYKGEFGVVRGDEIFVNNKKKNVTIWKGDALSNGGIAFLRAYGISKEIDRQFERLGGFVSLSERTFIANESPFKGDMHRNVELIIKITEPKYGV